MGEEAFYNCFIHLATLVKLATVDQMVMKPMKNRLYYFDVTHSSKTGMSPRWYYIIVYWSVYLLMITPCFLLFFKFTFLDRYSLNNKKKSWLCLLFQTSFRGKG